jgi:hypothetical protein
MRGVRGRLGLRRGGRCGRGCGRRGKERGVEVLHDDSLCRGSFGIAAWDTLVVCLCIHAIYTGCLVYAAYLSMLNPQLSSCTFYFIEMTE